MHEEHTNNTHISTMKELSIEEMTSLKGGSFSWGVSINFAKVKTDYDAQAGGGTSQAKWVDLASPG